MIGNTCYYGEICFSAGETFPRSITKVNFNLNKADLFESRFFWGGGGGGQFEPPSLIFHEDINITP